MTPQVTEYSVFGGISRDVEDETARLEDAMERLKLEQTGRSIRLHAVRLCPQISP